MSSNRDTPPSMYRAKREIALDHLRDPRRTGQIPARAARPRDARPPAVERFHETVLDELYRIALPQEDLPLDRRVAERPADAALIAK
jgi:hypothetical protein